MRSLIQAAVNLNFWLTPEDANLDKKSGGLVIYTQKPPAHWTFEQYNQVTQGSVCGVGVRVLAYVFMYVCVVMCKHIYSCGCIHNQVTEGGDAHALLGASGWANVTVPYKENRLVMFDSALFHKTDDFTFKKVSPDASSNNQLL